MLDALPGWVPPGGAVGLLLLAMWMMLTGRIVAGRTHDRALQRIDKLEATLEKRDAQISELMELSRTAVAAISALPKVRDPA